MTISLGKNSLIPQQIVVGRDAGLAQLQSDVAALAKREEEPVFSAIEKETIVLWGAADSSHIQTDKKSFLAYVPHARWIEFEHCGHFPDLENQEEYIRLLKQ